MWVAKKLVALNLVCANNAYPVNFAPAADNQNRPALRIAPKRCNRIVSVIINSSSRICLYCIQKINQAASMGNSCGMCSHPVRLLSAGQEFLSISRDTLTPVKIGW